MNTESYHSHFPGSGLLVGLAVTLFVLTASLLSAQSLANLQGVVADRSGAPLEGVRVTLQTETQVETVTDSTGRFSFDHVTANWLQLSFDKPGYRRLVRTIEPAAQGRVEVMLLATGEAIVADRIMVVGSREAGRQIPGSAHYVELVDEADPALGDVHQVLRQIPGLNLQEEEGFGLRPNIGMRGSGSERSAKITLMEDGVLIAPAPYAAPAAYYFPTVGRMRALEVRKGSSQVRFGPRTNGGVLNLLSRDIPGDFSVGGSLAGGTHSSGRLDLQVGNSSDRFGWLVETFQLRSGGFKRLDGGDETGFHLGDYLAKFRLSSDPAGSVYQQLEFKLGATRQRSDETYLGLTDADFEADALRRYAASQADRFDSDHEQFQLTYLLAPSASFDLTTSLYRNNFKRNWYKLQSVAGRGLPEVFDDPAAVGQELAILKGEADSSPDALRVRANNRSYYSQGIQSVAGFRLSDRHRLEAGLRYHQDQEDRFQHEDGFQMQGGLMRRTSGGAPGSQANRVGDARALALFAADTIELGRWRLTPGVRFERISLQRTDYSSSDPDRTAPVRVRDNTLNVWVPGIGVQFRADPTLSFFGGVHRGFSPPGPGSAEDTEPEHSINYEGGLRWAPGSFQLETVGFFNAYSNLLGADTLSSGGTGEGDLFNGGRARAWGLEVSATTDLAPGRLGAVFVPLRLAYTFTRTTFLEDFESDFGPWGTVTAGDHLPYIAPHQLFVGLGLEAPGWKLGIESVFVDRMRTEAGQGPVDPFRSTDSQLTFNVTGEYDLMPEGQRATLFVTVQNLTDERFIVARRPAGARPGLSRTLMAGIRFNLGR